MEYGSLFRRSKDLAQMSTTFIENKFILCFVFVIAAGNLTQFYYSGELWSIGIFLASGFLTSFFSNNLTVIMIIAIVVANICIIGTAKEGYRGKKDNNNKEKQIDAICEARAKKKEEDDDE